MKTMKKVLALVLALVMIMAITVTAFADEKAPDGSITVTNAKIGEEYTIYKIFDLTYSGTNVSYTADATVQAWLSADNTAKNLFSFAKVNDNLYNVSVKDGVTDAQIIAFFKSLKSGTTVDSHLAALKVAGPTEATGNTVEFTGLSYGYYLVDSTLGAVITLDSTLKDVEVIDKNTISDIDKEIIVGDSRVKFADAELGETINFEVKIPVYHYIGTDKVYKYYVFDQMNEALTPVLGADGKPAVTVKNGNTNVSFTVTTTGLTGANFRIDIPAVTTDGNFIFGNNDELTITYSAIVNEKVKDHIGTAMDNTAYINWITQPDSPDPVTPDPDKPKSTTENYPAEIKVKKVDPSGATLTGAKFSMTGFGSQIAMINKEIYVPYVAGRGDTQPVAYWMLKDGTYTADDPNTQGMDKTLYDDTTKKFMKISEVNQTTLPQQKVDATGYVNNNGILTFTGLGAGTYTITELVSPQGYNLLTAPITVVITFNAETKTYSATVDGTAATVDSGIITVSVINNTGSELPSTGGMGTTMFMVIGAILLLGASVILVSRKRMYNAN